MTLYCQWTVRVNVTVHITLRTCVRPGATENFVTENDETDGLINSQHGFIGKFILRFGWRFIILVRLGWRFITLVTCACAIVYRTPDQDSTLFKPLMKHDETEISISPTTVMSRRGASFKFPTYPPVPVYRRR